jgi:hypothetical protein
MRRRGPIRPAGERCSYVTRHPALPVAECRGSRVPSKMVQITSRLMALAAHCQSTLRSRGNGSTKTLMQNTKPVLQLLVLVSLVGHRDCQSVRLGPSAHGSHERCLCFDQPCPAIFFLTSIASSESLLIPAWSCPIAFAMRCRAGSALSSMSAGKAFSISANPRRASC